MPKTAVDEDNLTAAAEDYVWPSGELTCVKPEAITHSVQKATNRQFWRRVLGLHKRHALASLFWGKGIHLRSLTMDQCALR